MHDELRRYTRYGEKKAGTNNKFYEVEAVEEETGARWIFRWGRIGTTGQSKEGHTYSFEAAKQKCDEQFKSKRGRGYVERTAMEALASAVEELEERNVRGFAPVELDVPRFHAGKSEKRCQEFCQKWLDKLNIVRQSRWTLGDAYRKQAEGVLKGYCKEWRRICGTKAHGHLADNSHAQTAFRIFFGALKDSTKLSFYCYFEGVGSAY
jgi:predicted DNA-binding WGR domain protein